MLRTIMNKLVLFFYLLLGVSLWSCNSNKTASKTEELDTVWNEKVQNKFFGLTIGDSAEVDFIVANLQNKGFYFLNDCSSNTLLHFRSANSRFFSFGGLTWEMLDISIENSVLQKITFMNSSLDKAEAIGGYDVVKSAVDAKYSPTERISNDTTIYKKASYFGRNGVNVNVSCFRYETISKKIMIGTTLSYWTQKNIKPANDEL